MFLYFYIRYLLYFTIHEKSLKWKGTKSTSRNCTIRHAVSVSVIAKNILLIITILFLPSASTRLFYYMKLFRPTTIPLNRLQRMFKEEKKEKCSGVSEDDRAKPRWKQSYSFDHITDVRKVRDLRLLCYKGEASTISSSGLFRRISPEKGEILCRWSMFWGFIWAAGPFPKRVKRRTGWIDGTWAAICRLDRNI